MESALKSQLAALPHTSGVYIYKNSDNDVLYVGKAVNLKRRVKQYFVTDSSLLSDKTKILVSQIAHIDTIQTASEFDAILLEAKLIYQYQPKYNVIAKDDKSPLYIKITFSERLPGIFFVRKPKTPSYGATHEKGDMIFGPFQSGGLARNLMRDLRRSTPYCLQKRRNGRPCFYTHLGLCDPCPSEIEKMPDGIEKNALISRYRQGMYRLRDILVGKTSRVITQLLKEMKQSAGHQEFEKAKMIHHRIESLYHMLARRYDPMIYVTSDRGVDDIVSLQLQELRQILLGYFPTLASLGRIECVDISNMGGKNATGSLVVLTGGVIDKSAYRRFRIGASQTPNDVAMMTEVLTRRFRHSDWEKPDLLIVDGGKGQVACAVRVIQSLGMQIPVVGLAKRYEEIIVPQPSSYKTIRINLASPALLLVRKIRDEAHRFAITYHRHLRSASHSPAFAK